MWCSVISGQSLGEQAVSTDQDASRGPQLQQQRPADAGARLSNGALEPTDQDSAARLIDLQASLDKQVRSPTRRGHRKFCLTGLSGRRAPFGAQREHPPPSEATDLALRGWHNIEL